MRTDKTEWGMRRRMWRRCLSSRKIRPRTSWREKSCAARGCQRRDVVDSQWFGRKLACHGRNDKCRRGPAVPLRRTSATTKTCCAFCSSLVVCFGWSCRCSGNCWLLPASLHCVMEPSQTSRLASDICTADGCASACLRSPSPTETQRATNLRWGIWYQRSFCAAYAWMLLVTFTGRNLHVIQVVIGIGVRLVSRKRLSLHKVDFQLIN